MKHRRRSLRLIRPGLQLRLILVFLALSAFALLLQYLVFMRVITHVALYLPHDGLILLDELNKTLGFVLAVSFAVFLPITFVVGILTTHRFAGPIYRFERFLREVQRGERPRDCTLRNGDELKDFCALLNEVTAPLRHADPPSIVPSRTAAQDTTAAPR
jgi:signal peptidase II